MPIIVQEAPAEAVVPQEQYLREAVAYVTTLKAADPVATLHLFKQGEVGATFVTTAAAYGAAECDYTGYAAVALTADVFEPYEDQSDGSFVVTIPSHQFNHGAVGTANDVGGWFITDENDVVIGAGNFAEPVVMAGPLDSLVLSISRRFGP
jgi:hypothetical protein